MPQRRAQLARSRRRRTGHGAERRRRTSRHQARLRDPRRWATRSSSRSSTAPSSPPRPRRRPAGHGPGRRLATSSSRSIQGLVQTPASQGIATSVPGATLADPLNEIIESGIPSCSSTCSTRASTPPTSASARSSAAASSARPSWRSSVAQTCRPARSSSATASPASRCSRTATQGVPRSLAAAPGLEVVGPFDVKVAADRELRRVGGPPHGQPGRGRAHRPVRPRPRQPRPAAGGQPRHDFVAGRLRPDRENLAALEDGNAYVSLGQTPFMQGYLPDQDALDIDHRRAPMWTSRLAASSTRARRS